MKRIGWIGIMVLLALAACNRPYDGPVETRHGTSLQTRATSLPTIASPTLSAVDSLMWRQPDSALVVLMGYLSDDGRDGVHTVSTTTEYENHYANLLLAELLYKNDYAQTNRTELLRAVDYYDSLCGCRDAARHVSTNPNIAFLDARAHYINGVGYYEHDSAVEACKEYLKALEVMEERFEEKELVGEKAQFMAMTHTRLTVLFSELYLHEQAMYFGKLSLPYYIKQNSSSWHLSWMLNEIGSQYDMMEQLDSAEYYYQKAELALNDTNIILYRDIATHLACLTYKKSPSQKDTTIKQLFHLLSESENDLERLARCALIGEMYYHEKQYDSSWLYLNKVYHETPNNGTKKQAAEWLVEICRVQGKTLEMFEYAEFLVPFANQEENNSGLKSQLSESFYSFKQNKLEMQHYKLIKKRSKQALLVLGGTVAIMLTIAYFYRKNKRSKQKLEVQMEAERFAHRMQQAALAGRLKQSNAALKEISKTNTNISQTSISLQQNELENYCEEPICKKILEVCNDKDNSIKSTVPVSAYIDIALSDAQKAQLKDAAMRHYGQLFEKLNQQYPELKEKDYYYCFLCLLGLDNAQIAVMMQLSYRTIWEREKRLQAIFHTNSRIVVTLHEMMIY